MVAAQGSGGTCPLLPSLAEATHLHLLLVLLGAAAPHLLHQPREQVVRTEIAAGELAAALRAGGDLGAAVPVLLDAALAEVVHAVQHDGLAEELAADGTGQLLPQAPVLAPAGHPCWHTAPTLSFLPPPPHTNAVPLDWAGLLPSCGLGQGLVTRPWRGWEGGPGPAQLLYWVHAALENPELQSSPERGSLPLHGNNFQFPITSAKPLSASDRARPCVPTGPLRSGQPARGLSAPTHSPRSSRDAAPPLPCAAPLRLQARGAHRPLPWAQPQPPLSQGPHSA